MQKMRIIQVTFLLCSLFHDESIASFHFHTHRQSDFTVRWKNRPGTIYSGNSVDELLAMCPAGCGAGCNTFPVYGPNGTATAPPVPCTNDDIKALRKAQELAQEWKDLMHLAPRELFWHSAMLLIILVLILFLLIRGHYRIRDLWFLPSDRQWELERDPTWGLPGKVWTQLEIRVIKTDPNSEPRDRKYISYTDNPTTLGDKYWSYKQALRDMYKTHKYYKRNRFFHKLAWQFIKLKKLIPETLRRHKSSRRAGELEEERSNASSAEVDPQENLPWEADLANEVNIETLKNAKATIQGEIDKISRAGHFIQGRFQHLHQHQHHHHHHHAAQVITPLTKEEIENTARQLEVDPNIDCVNVDGLMRRLPAAAKGERMHQHHHHHHHHHQQQQKPAPVIVGPRLTKTKL